MKKLYYKTDGYEPHVNCIEPCTYENRPKKDTMIGSASCKKCRDCYGWDNEESWVKCLSYSLEKQRLSEDRGY